MHRNPTRKRVACLPLLVVTVLLAAQPPGPVRAAEPAESRQAEGTVSSRSWEWQAFGAYAFPAEVVIDDEPGIKVAISNSGFATTVLDRDFDREHMIDTFLRDDETLVAYFHFSKSGAYEGLSYYFSSGDGCGFCYDSKVQSTVKVEKGRIHGSLKRVSEPDDIQFDLAFDVPVAPADYGDPLPAGGGEPGKAYAALHTALLAWDYAGARPYFTEKVQADYAEKSEAIVQSFRKDHPDTSFRIVRGYGRGDRALLLVEGETSWAKVKTEVQMLREKGSWRLESEVLQVRLGED